MKGFREPGIGRLVGAAAFSTLLAFGCSSGTGSVDVKFPDVSTLPQPKEVRVGSGSPVAGVTSQGEPGDSSRAK